MKRFRKVIFYGFLIFTVSVLTLAIWLFSRTPGKEQIAGVFPLQSFQTFSEGEKMTLYSLYPKTNPNAKESFQNYGVIGKTEIQNRGFQKFLKHTFLNDLANSPEQGAACFFPRHGLRIEKNGETVDILICYECGNFVIFSKDEKGSGGILGTSEVLLNQTLKDAKIEIAPSSK